MKVRGVPHIKTKDGIRIQVRVGPRASRRSVSGLMGNMLKVSLTAAPVDGAANEQLIEVLSEVFGVKKRDIRIVTGLSSKNKVVEIRGVTGD